MITLTMAFGMAAILSGVIIGLQSNDHVCPLLSTWCDEHVCMCISMDDMAVTITGRSIVSLYIVWFRFNCIINFRAW
jgi:hypothetical protein